MYKSGWGGNEDPKEAARWYRKAADQGYAKVQYELGTMYCSGNGVTKDLKEVVRW